ncbi:MAG: hypothetical protein CME70_07575 [Halobacteriovorax sp.]|nr:hypothetical protein [Halobacteriovorax sp.]|tara:strand:+ start:324277 stop:325659 length:1383 start_codon:yes stop_codon:yes gene_type:complete
MGKLKTFLLVFIYFLFLTNCSFALTPENIFQNDLEMIELLGNKIRLSENKKAVNFGSKRITEFLKDPENRVNDLFEVTPYFKKDITFWFHIYTVFSSHHIVLHDKENLGLVYDVIEFDELKSSKLNNYTKYALQRRLTKERIKLVKKDFVYLQKNRAKSVTQKKIVNALKKVGFKIPKPSKKRRQLFKNLANNLRSQTGQKDKIQNGIDRYAPYSKTFEKWLMDFNLPKELMWISFIESSFNTKARSKVGATGTWQFMKRIGKYFMPYSKYKDGRLNPAMSTLAAFHLLHQNKKILKRWDLAIPAYNSGTKHIIKARRKLKLKAPKLEQVLSSYDHPHLGFASNAFYSEFVALSHAQAYREHFYDLKKFKKKYKEINVFVTKCSITKSWFTKQLKRKEPYIYEYNSHLKYKKRKYKKGTIVFSTTNLTKKRYLKLTPKQLRRKYPKNYKQYVKGQSCSTK